MDISQLSQAINILSHMSLTEAAPLINQLAPLIAKMANSGVGTDSCLNHGCLPLPVHYYSPIPDITDLKNRNIWKQRSSLPGIHWDEQSQLEFLALLGKNYGTECHWPAENSGHAGHYYTENNSFIFGCAAAAHCVIRHFKPKRLIEIGSGFSSLIINEALSQNAGQSHPCEYTIIDPYPQSFVSGLSQLHSLMGQRVELVSPTFFRKLQPSDILFIDSSHMVRIGSDVNFLILEVLPSLNSGLVIHFHDIPMPYEYPESYLTNPSFRMLWTESYLLQAFLSHNPNFKILLAMSWIMAEHLPEFRKAFPHYNPSIHRNFSGSFWIQKKG